MNPLLSIGLILGGLFLLDKRHEPKKPIRRNLDAYTDSSGIHPIRASSDYDPERAGEKLRASGDLRAFLTDIDKDIAKAKRAKKHSDLEDLQDLRTNTILLSLPKRRQKEYEDAQEQLYQLEVIREPRTRPELDPVYRFRDLANMARKYGEEDVNHPQFKAAVKKRYGMSLDEIGEKLFPGVSNGDELAVERAISLQRGRKQGQSMTAIDEQITRLRQFVKSVETAAIFGVGKAQKPKHARTTRPT